MKSFAFTILLAAAAAYQTNVANAQVVKHDRLFSFEDAVPAEFSTDKISLRLNQEHFKDGHASLAWKFAPNSVLSVKKDLHFEPIDETGKDLYMSAFIVWIYNEKAMDKHIEFQFLKDGKRCTSFPFNINFTGWRAAWVCYERDMKGTPEVGMNEIRVVAPDVEGELFIDHMITATKVDARQQAPDFQIPFVHKDTDNHWLVIYKNSKLKADLALSPVTEEEKQQMQLIEDRYLPMIYSAGKVSDKEVERIRNCYDKYAITYKDGKVNGLPIFLCRQAEAYERMIPNWDKDMFTYLGMEMKEYFDLMKSVAVAYRNAKDGSLKQEMKEKFLAMYAHITDQGVANGSCWGNIHHYGYSTRGLFTSYFLMKDVLREANKLDEAVATLQWYAILNEINPRPLVDGIDMDSFNTKAPGRLMSILIMEDCPEKVRYLKAFSRWIDYGCRPSKGLAGSFKVDGSAMHHRNNYPAYAVGGLDGATTMIYLLNGTKFAISELAHSTVNNVLLKMRFYCNTYQWPLSMSGRHPNGKGHLIPYQYGLMALAGTPDGSKKYDPTMAAAFLRLTQNADKQDKKAPDYLPKSSTKAIQKIKDELEQHHFKPEPSPQGNLGLGYACVSVQRDQERSAVVRGHSRYLWCAEHYLGANYYGRYLGYGSMQIFANKEDNQTVSLASSGWQENGFDWNRIPGVTSIHLPFEKLRANVMNVDTFSGMEEMLYSDEAFAGPLSQEKENGNFGMILHEHDKYNGSHRARISYHFFGDKIVALGTNIENEVTEYPTETTVFQLAAASDEELNYWKGWKDNGHTYIDPNGVGYWVPQRAHFIKAFPQVTVGERSPKPTKGNWVSLIIEHGKAPKNATYEYMVKLKTSQKEMTQLAKDPGYEVIRKDKEAHIVKDNELQITSYVLFEKPTSKLPGDVLTNTDTSCLAMVKKINKNKIVLTVAQPDLAFYTGKSDEKYDENGKRVERSIYSRPWIDNDSKEQVVTVTLKKKWKLNSSHDNITVISANKQQTVIAFRCKDGKSYDVSLTKE